MSLNGKRDNFTSDDFYSLEKLSTMFTRAKINTIVDETIEKLSDWPQLAREHDVPKPLRDLVETNLRFNL